MDSEVIQELVNQIESMRRELTMKEMKISELEEVIANMQREPNNNPSMEAEESKAKRSWSGVNTASKFKTFVANTIKFCHSTDGDNSKIEFPISLSNQSSERAYLLRGLSTNSLIARVLEDIREISSKKKILEDEVSKNREEINESARKTIEAMEQSFSTPLKSLQDEIVNSMKTIKDELETGLVIETTSQKLFLVENIDSEKLQISLIQLKDSYGIALKEPKTITKSIYDFDNMRAVIKSETDSIMNTLDTCQLTVYYQLIEVENNEKICCPINILPDGIGLQDYEIKFSNTQHEITEIVNKNEGAIKFTTIVVSEDCGLIQASVIELFTHEMSDHILNVLHLHVEDMKEEIPLDAIYMLPEQSSQEYEDWSKDFTGLELRYKLLVKSGKVDSILYNTGSTTEYIHFLERRIKIGDYYKYENYIVQVMSVPTGLLTRDWQGKKSDCGLVYTLNKPESHCLARHAIDLPGLVDVKIIMSQGDFVKDGSEIAVPACQCVELNAKEKLDLQQSFKFLEENKSNVIQEQVKKIEALVEKYNMFNVKDNKSYLNELTNIVRDVKESICDDVEMRSKYQIIIGQAERVIRNVAIDIRFNGQ
ncbi:hypothetical protein SteCoe_4971 [Stentor coeruleus]|uniref:Uncharacterized protein n=1 Tax=Stentor coeruleus TaxID=5963 RepID=A0A1R2CTG6_9CILI|nr:hypothetical protein SteCoe_4971 [Stentor coeruleus]